MRDVRWRGRAIAVAGSGAVVATALTVLVVTDTWLPALDRRVLTTVNTHRPDPLTGVAGAIADVFAPAVDVTVLLLAALLLTRRRRTIVPVLVATGALAALVAVVLAVKVGVARPSPPPHHSTDGGAFPSGHTTATLVCYGTLAMLLAGERRVRRGRRVALATVPTVFVGTALVYGGMHWLTDVLAALAFGAVILAFVHLARVRTILSVETERSRERAGMTDTDELSTPEPTEEDERNNQRLQHLVEDAVLRGKPYNDEHCGNCLYYLDADADLSYCWHPKIRILVGTGWWCQWWEEIPAS